MRFGHYRKGTRIFRCGGVRSSRGLHVGWDYIPRAQQIIQAHILRCQNAWGQTPPYDPKAKFAAETQVFGNGGFGSITSAMRRITQRMWIIAIGTQLSMGLWSGPLIGRIRQCIGM
jgi:hypothetical protein